jgi:HAD superfamily hydrolase (TIGR01509 family)
MSTARLRALLWDVDGTLAETERDGHRLAFNQAFAEAGLPWHWDVARYGELLTTTGGYERILRDMAEQPDAPTTQAQRESLARRLHQRKNMRYAEIVATGGIRLRPGVAELMDEAAAAGVALGIATTTSRSNVDALLGAAFGMHWADRFAVVACAEDAPRKKPDPEVYQVALQRLDLATGEVIAIEDSPAGVSAANAAGIPVVVTRSVYFATAALATTLAVGPSLASAEGWQPTAAAGRIGLAQLRAWHAHAD